MKIKVSEASGLALNWMVATCEGYTNLRVGAFAGGGLFMDPPRVAYGAVDFSDLNYSYDWAQGGPIIEREQYNLYYDASQAPDVWQADVGLAALVRAENEWPGHGPTPLIAAMRCYAEIQLGEEVDVPDVLINQSTEN